MAQQPGDPGTGDHDITQPWVTISPPVVAEDDPRNETLALVIADNLELTLRLIGQYVVRPRPTERTAPTDAASAAVYAAREEVDYVVFGEVSERADGSTEFSLFVYSRETGTVTLERRAVAETIFDTFEVADELATEVLGAFTGQRIAYGRVELANLGEAGAEYQVLVDGTVVGRNLISVDRVLVGERLVEVEVLTGPQAGEVVVSRRLLMEEGTRERLEFTALAPLPVPEPEELLVEVPEEQAEEPETETEIAAAPEPDPEPEIPLELRAYRWRRNDPGRSWTASLAYQFHFENRPDWDESLSLMGMRGRFDWGARHSLLLGYEGNDLNVVNYSNNSRFFSENEVGEPVTFEPGPLQRAYMGYGLRSRPLGPITVIPSLRAGIERQYYLAYAGDRGGSDENADLVNPDYEYSQSFWAGSLGFDLALEITLRRFLLYGSVGALGVLPFNPDYDEIIRGRDTETEEAIEFRAEGSIGTAFGWYAGMGIGYAFGGNEGEVNRVSVESRSYRSFAGALSRNWGVALGLEGSIVHAFGSEYSSLINWPTPNAGMEIAHVSGYVTGVRFALASAHVKPTTVLWAFDDDPMEPKTDTGSQEVSFFGTLTVSVGRRLRISDTWFLKPTYRFGMPQYYWSMVIADDVESGGYKDDLVVHGPGLVLEYSMPGTAATVYAAGHVTMIAPLGETDYVTGMSGRGGTVLAADGYFEGYHHASLDVGVLFRLAGMPPRLLSEDSRGEWRRYSEPSLGTTGVTGGRENPGFFRRWVTPRLAVGTGVEWHGQTYGDSITGLVTVFPMTLRFPFGLEIVAQGAVPFTGDNGVQGDREELNIVTEDPESSDVRASGFSRVTRLFSLEVGYRFFSRRRLSVRPGVRVTWLDHELWGIRNELEDGSIIEAGDERFARGEIGVFAGPALDVLFRVSNRISLTAGGGVVVRVADADVIVNPAFSPELEYRHPSNFIFLGVGAALEL